MEYRVVKFSVDNVRKGQEVLNELARESFEVVQAIAKNQDVIVIAQRRNGFWLTGAAENTKGDSSPTAETAAAVTMTYEPRKRPGRPPKNADE